jgi:thiamine kinase-like enzyme
VDAPEPHGPTARPSDRDIEELLDRVPSLAGRPRTVERLPGGLTNTNVKVTLPSGCVVARMSSKDSALLSIDREVEHRNSLAAAASGAAPDVVDYAPEHGVLVVRYIVGRTYTPADLLDGANLERSVAAVRLLHSGPRFVNDFDMFRVQRDYLEIVRSNGFRLPAGYLDYLPQVERIAAVLRTQEAETVPCNNDLLAGNFIDDGNRVWLIDYEYSGNNDACFELGNIWSEADLPLDHLDELVRLYYGRELPSMVARARLLGLMSKYGWTLWAAIQSAKSELDFDFWAWGMEKYERAVAEFSGPDFDRLLTEAQKPDG